MVPRHPSENGLSTAFLDELGRLLRAAADNGVERPSNLHRAATLLAEGLDADRVSLVTPTGGGALRVVASSDPDTVGDLVTSLDRYPELHRVLAGGSPVLQSTEDGDSLAVVPIRLSDIAGVLRLSSHSRRFDGRDLERLLAVTAHLEQTLAGASPAPPQPGPWGTLATVLADAVVEVAIDGRITALFQGRRQRLPLSQQLVGRPISELLAHPGPAGPRPLTALELGEITAPESFEVVVQPPRATSVAATASVVRTDGLPPRSLIALLATESGDRTEAAAAERESRLRARLEESLEDLERTQLRLAEVESARHRFISASAHELKTPITVVRSYLEILLNDLGEGLTEEQLSFVRIAHESVLRLRRLVGDLVDLAALDSGRIQLDIGRVEVAPVLESVLTEQHTLAANAGLTVECGATEPGLAVRASADRVEQVLRNLLDNALKFTPAGGTVTLSATGHDDSVALAVHDTGIGIAADALGTIFEEFVQAEAPGDMRRRGAGLGLAIARRVVRAMGGRLSVDSRRGVGSTFTVWLPRWPEEE